MGSIHVSAQMNTRERTVKPVYRTVRWNHVQMGLLVLYVTLLSIDFRNQSFKKQDLHNRINSDHILLCFGILLTSIGYCSFHFRLYSFRMYLVITILVFVQKVLPVATVKLLLTLVLIYLVKMVPLVQKFIELSFVVVYQDGPVLLAMSRSGLVMEYLVLMVVYFSSF